MAAPTVDLSIFAWSRKFCCKNNEFKPGKAGCLIPLGENKGYYCGGDKGPPNFPTYVVDFGDLLRPVFKKMARYTSATPSYCGMEYVTGFQAGV